MYKSKFRKPGSHYIIFARRSVSMGISYWHHSIIGSKISAIIAVAHAMIPYMSRHAQKSAKTSLQSITFMKITCLSNLNYCGKIGNENDAAIHNTLFMYPRIFCRDKVYMLFMTSTALAREYGSWIGTKILYRTYHIFHHTNEISPLSIFYTLQNDEYSNFTYVTSTKIIQSLHFLIRY